jgi:hypothetical protein
MAQTRSPPFRVNLPSALGIRLGRSPVPPYGLGMTEPEKRSCAVCARVLHALETTDRGVTWIHSLQDQPEDHIPIPVEPHEVRTAYRCDFCAVDESVYVVGARPFPMPGTPNTMSSTDWSACAPCAALVEANQWSALARRVMASWEARQGLPMPEHAITAIRAMYRALRKNLTGTIEPLNRPREEQQG